LHVSATNIPNNGYMASTSTTTSTKAINGNRLIYGAFTLAGCIFLALQNYSNATIYLGLALAFDPFDTAQPLDQRPTYQKVWLTVHAIAAIVALVGLLWFH